MSVHGAEELDFPVIHDDSAAAGMRDVNGTAPLAEHAFNRLVLRFSALVVRLEVEAVKVANAVIVAEFAVIGIGGEVVFGELYDRTRAVSDCNSA